MVVAVKVNGLRQMNRNLKKLKGREATNIMRAASRAAANVVLKESRKNLPGYHKKKVALVPSRRESSKIKFVFNIGPLAKHWALAFLEYGVEPHDITPKTKKVLVSFLGDDFIASKVKHPGIRRTSWLSKAFNESTNKSVNAFTKKVNDRIKKALLKR